MEGRESHMPTLECSFAGGRDPSYLCLARDREWRIEDTRAEELGEGHHAGWRREDSARRGNVDVGGQSFSDHWDCGSRELEGTRRDHLEDCRGNFVEVARWPRTVAAA